ncbi:cupin [Rhodocyclus tenuis]|uniref:Acireductone dioxygenase n=1 Tax=Rhodocyclus gracilis TaxID=2929842 RepID=A0ABX0WD91_9RHOO|nr:cupin [Rhodocyclus gracilis]NJA87647.1 cupin [Rhodocyclus gracilis]
MSVFSIHSATFPSSHAALSLAAQAGEVIHDHAEIARRLAALGVRFERWQAAAPLPVNADAQTVLAAYREPLAALKAEYGFQSVDVIRVQAGHPDQETLRQKFLAEHTHNDFEVRFFVEGRGLFYLHVGETVFALLCEQGDLVSVPANTSHWFDMGETPDFTCIRLFTREDGWAAEFSGDPLPASFPSLEGYAAAVSALRR